MTENSDRAQQIVAEAQSMLTESITRLKQQQLALEHIQKRSEETRRLRSALGVVLIVASLAAIAYPIYFFSGHTTKLADSISTLSVTLGLATIVVSLQSIKTRSQRSEIARLRLRISELENRLVGDITSEQSDSGSFDSQP